MIHILGICFLPPWGCWGCWVPLVWLCNQIYVIVQSVHCTVESVVFSLWSECDHVLCWASRQTTVASLSEPLLLCCYEGSPLCDWKTIFVVAQRFRTVCTAFEDGLKDLGYRNNLSFFFCLKSVTQQSGAGSVLLFSAYFSSLITDIFFCLFSSKQTKMSKTEKKKRLLSLLEKAFFVFSCMLKCR